MKRKLRKYAGGGVDPMSLAMQGQQFSNQLGGEFANITDQLSIDENGNQTKLGTFGSAFAKQGFNPLMGGISGVAALMNKKKQDEARKKQEYENSIRNAQQQFAMSNTPQYQNIPTFKCGGKIKKYPDGGKSDTTGLQSAAESYTHSFFAPLRNKYKERVYNAIQPSDYYEGTEETLKNKVKDVIKGTKRTTRDDPYSEDAWRMYLGLEQTNNTLSKSKYAPSTAKDKNQSYYSLPKDFRQDLFDSMTYNIDGKKAMYQEFSDAPEGKSIPYSELKMPNVSGENSQFRTTSGSPASRGRVLGNFSVSRGFDKEKNLPYVSYYDKYDLHPLANKGVQPDGAVDKLINKAVGNPYEVYDRIYYNPESYEIQEFAKGGYSVDNRGFANSELEDQEVYRTPQGSMHQVNGNSHAEGGEMYNLPQGTEILGKNKVPGSNKSFKEYGQRLMRDYNKFNKILDNKPTGLAKKTAERMLQKTQEGFSNLMQTQEMAKGTHQMPDGSIMANEDMGQYAKGGWIQKAVNPEHKGYCNPMTKSTCTPHRKALARRFKSGDLSKHPDGGIQQNEDPQIGLQDWMLNTSTWGPQSNLSNPLISDFHKYGSNKYMSEPRSFDVEPYLEAIGTYAPIAYNLGQGLFGKAEKLNPEDYYNPYENKVTNLMANRKYNINSELQSNRQAQLNYIRGLRQGAPSQSQYLSNLGQSQINRSRSDAEAYSRKQNIENEYQGQYAQMLAGLGQNKAATKLNIKDINSQNLAAKRNFTSTGLSQLQQATQMRRLMKNLKGTEDTKKRLLKDLFKGYNFNLGEN